MSGKIAEYCQYRSFNYIYETRNKENKTVLEVLDVNQNSIFKETVFAPEKGSSWKKKNRWMLRCEPKYFIKIKNLPEKLACRTSRKGLDELILDLDKIIFKQKAKDQFDHPGLKKLSCPITYEPFVEPVIDEHGHTFEKSAIEEHLNNNPTCPINRQPINVLSPNRVVREQIEEMRVQEPIPVLGKCKQENVVLASKAIEMARAYAEHKEFSEAEEAFKKAFQYTNKFEEYAKLVALYEKMGEFEKALLAKLYLVRYLLQTDSDGGDYLQDKAIEILEKISNRSVDLNLILINLYLICPTEADIQKSVELAIQTARDCSNEFPDKAAEIYRSVLEENPEQIQLYEPLLKLVDPKLRTHILYKGTIDSLQQGKRTESLGLYRKFVKVIEKKTWRDVLLLSLFQSGEDQKSQLSRDSNYFLNAKQYKDLLKIAKCQNRLNPTPDHASLVVKAYISIAEEALLEDKVQDISKCVRKIQLIDPQMEILRTQEQSYILLVGLITKLSEKVLEQEKVIDSFKNRR